MKNITQHLLDHLPVLLRVGRRLTRSDADAEDLAQDTLLRALTRMGDVRDPERTRAWLLSVQRTVFLNGKRGMRARLEVLDGGLSEKPIEKPGGDLEKEILSRSVDDALLAALNDLPNEWRDALLLREVDELSYAEIAEVQGCPVGTVRSRLARARESLHRTLSSEENGNVRMYR